MTGRLHDLITAAATLSHGSLGAKFENGDSGDYWYSMSATRGEGEGRLERAIYPDYLSTRSLRPALGEGVETSQASYRTHERMLLWREVRGSRMKRPYPTRSFSSSSSLELLSSSS